MKTHITLIHGTFARGAPWAKTDSNLARALKEEFGDSVELHTFEWSGRNTASARIQAARDLVMQLRLVRSEDKDPKARHFIIGHSHGGNIGFYAMANQAITTYVTGICCLSTPFFHVQPTLLGRNRLEHTYPVFFHATSLILLPSIMLGVFGMNVILGTAVSVLSTLLIHATFIHLAIKGEILKSGMAIPVLPAKRSLIVRFGGDEATAAHSLFQSAIRFTMRLAVLLSFPVEYLSQWRWMTTVRVVFMTSATFFVIPLIREAQPVFDAQHIFVSIFVGLALSLVFSRTVLISLISMLTTLISSILIMPFGPDLATITTKNYLSVESAPVGEHTVIHIPAPTEWHFRGMGMGLTHSQAYSDSRVVRLIVNWISEFDSEFQEMGEEKAAIYAEYTECIGEPSDLEKRHERQLREYFGEEEPE